MLCYLCYYKLLQLDPLKAPRDHMQPKPNIVNVGPQLFHSPQLSHSPPTDFPSREEEVPSLTHHHTTPLEPLTMPPQLATTLEHIVGQLDILTQVSTVL